MKIGLRADASSALGTGHLIRQLALAEHLVEHEHEVFLIGSVAGPAWLVDELERNKNLQLVEVQESDFSLRTVGRLDLDALLIDSYALSQDLYSRLEEALPRVGVLIDGPWQKLRGKLAIAPTLRASPTWIEHYHRDFLEIHWGPKFLMLRETVRAAKNLRLKKPSGEAARVVVAMGGSDVGGLTQTVLDLVVSLPFPCHIDVFSASIHSLDKNSNNNGITVNVHPAGRLFIDYACQASLVISAAGTTMAELTYLEVPAIYVPVAGNQSENIEAIKELGLGIVVEPDRPDFQALLRAAIESVLQNSSGVSHYRGTGQSIIDGAGASRVAEILTGAYRPETRPLE